MRFFLGTLLKNLWRRCPGLPRRGGRGSSARNPYRSTRHSRVNVARHPKFPRAPIPLCITGEALQELLETVGSYPPETGAKGFSLASVLGFEVLEFDIRGSSTDHLGIYKPDVEWGNIRCQHHLDSSPIRLWSGDCHSHPKGAGLPSQGKEGQGDLAYVREVFRANEWMQWFLIPIVTFSQGRVWIHPWVCRRGDPPALYSAELQICSVSNFPPREFNPEWEQRVVFPSRFQDDIQGEEPIPIDFQVLKTALRGEYTKRLEGILSPAFGEKTILTVGVGAGSGAVENLARCCPRRIRNCDFDRIELSNLSRTNYTFIDATAERLKVDALARRIEEVNPLVEVESCPGDITKMSPLELENLLDGADIIVAGTDNFEAQALLNTLAVQHQIPAVFIGIHAGAEGGRIIWYLPGETPCFRCVAKERFERIGDLEDLNLKAAMGSLVDGQFIDTVATKVILAILERGQESRMGKFFEGMGSRNDIVVRCDPGYSWGNMFWDLLLGSALRTQALFAMDTIWLPGEYDPNCPDCGGRGKEGSRG